MRAAVATSAYMPRGGSTTLVLSECSVAQGQGLFVFITQMFSQFYVCMCTTDSPK